MSNVDAVQQAWQKYDRLRAKRPAPQNPSMPASPANEPPSSAGPAHSACAQSPELVGAKLIDGLVAIARHCWRGVHWEKGHEGPRMVRQPLFKAHLEAHLTDGPAVGLAPIVPGESVTRLALLDLDSHRG